MAVNVISFWDNGHKGVSDPLVSMLLAQSGIAVVRASILQSEKKDLFSLTSPIEDKLAVFTVSERNAHCKQDGVEKTLACLHVGFS